MTSSFVDNEPELNYFFYTSWTKLRSLSEKSSKVHSRNQYYTANLTPSSFQMKEDKHEKWLLFNDLAVDLHLQTPIFAASSRQISCNPLSLSTSFHPLCQRHELRFSVSNFVCLFNIGVLSFGSQEDYFVDYLSFIWRLLRTAILGGWKSHLFWTWLLKGLSCLIQWRWRSEVYFDFTEGVSKWTKYLSMQ